MQGLWIAIGFLVAALTAQTLLPSLPLPFAYIPLMLILGVLVMHRSGVAIGVLWLLFSGIIVADGTTIGVRIVAFAAAALIGALFGTRIFARRSVYALIGLGGVVGMTFLLVQWIASATLIFFSRPHVTPYLGSEARWTFVFLMLGLYVGFVVLVSSQKWFSRIFVVRNL